MKMNIVTKSVKETERVQIGDQDTGVAFFFGWKTFGSILRKTEHLGPTEDIGGLRIDKDGINIYVKDRE